MQVLRFQRPYEDVCFEDPAENPDTPRFRVWFDDRSIEGMLGKVANAIDRAQAVSRALDGDVGEEERAGLTDQLARLEKRVIVTFIGEEGYDALLAWMGDGEPVDPTAYTNALGEVMATFLTMLGRKATSEQLRACGLYYSEQRDGLERMARAAGAPRGKHLR